MCTNAACNMPFLGNFAKKNTHIPACFCELHAKDMVKIAVVSVVLQALAVVVIVVVTVAV